MPDQKTSLDDAAEETKKVFKRTLKDIKHNQRVERYKDLRKTFVGKGGPKKLSLKMIDMLCYELAKGHYPEVACRIINIDERTLNAWMEKGLEDKNKIEHAFSQGVKIRARDISLEHKLYDAIQLALHEAEDRDLAVLDSAAQSGIWQAAAHRLERRFTKRWGKKIEHDNKHSGEINVNGTVQHVILTPDQSNSIDEWQKERALRNSGQAGAPIVIDQGIPISPTKVVMD